MRAGWEKFGSSSHERRGAAACRYGVSWMRQQAGFRTHLLRAEGGRAVSVPAKYEGERAFAKRIFLKRMPWSSRFLFS